MLLFFFFFINFKRCLLLLTLLSTKKKKNCSVDYCTNWRERKIKTIFLRLPPHQANQTKKNEKKSGNSNTNVINSRCFYLTQFISPAGSYFAWTIHAPLIVAFSQRCRYHIKLYFVYNSRVSYRRKCSAILCLVTNLLCLIFSTTPSSDYFRKASTKIKGKISVYGYVAGSYLG